jgi:hypothetical protein
MTPLFKPDTHENDQPQRTQRAQKKKDSLSSLRSLRLKISSGKKSVPSAYSGVAATRLYALSIRG